MSTPLLLVQNFINLHQHLILRAKIINFYPQNWTKFLEQLTIACDSILVEFHYSMSRIDPCFLLSNWAKNQTIRKIKIYRSWCKFIEVYIFTISSIEFFQNFWNQCAPTKTLRNYRQGDAMTGDDVPMTSTPYQKLQIFLYSAYNK